MHVCIDVCMHTHSVCVGNDFVPAFTVFVRTHQVVQMLVQFVLWPECLWFTFGSAVFQPWFGSVGGSACCGLSSYDEALFHHWFSSGSVVCGLIVYGSTFV